MNLSEKTAKLLAKGNPHNLSKNTVYKRLERGWNEDKVMVTPNITKTIPKRSHPYKDASYIKMAAKKIYRTHKRKNND